MARVKSKSIDNLLKKLEVPQRAAVVSMLRKISEGEPLSKADVGLVGYSFRAMPQNLVAECFRVSRQSIHTWEKEGCPRNTDNTYDVFLLHQWRLDQESAKHKKEESLKDKKTLEEIKKLQIDNKKKSEVMITVSEHVEKTRSWASSFWAFYKTAIRRNAHLFEGLERREEAEILLEEFGKKLMEVWSGANGK